MTQEREYVRFNAVARVQLRPLAGDEEAAVRSRVRSHRVPPALTGAALDEARLSAEARMGLELIRHIAISLERIERRLQAIGSDSPESARGPITISLSGSGFSAPLGEEFASGTVIEVEIDLDDGSVPAIQAVACVVGPGDLGVAFKFEEISPDDRERIIQLAIRSQSQALRAERIGEA